MATASDDDDDPIVEEIDVYLAKGLADKLYLFQYPVRPAGMTYDSTPHLATRIKPKLHKVELELGINVTSPNYSRSKGEQIALNVDGAHGDDGGSCTYATKLMDRQLLCSSQMPGSASRYAIALYRRGELHITPLQGVMQMRPSFSYLDKADSKHKDKDAAQDGDSSQEEAEDDVKQVTVRFARPESDRAKQRRMQSYEYMQQKQAEEPWFNLRHHGSKDGRADHERQYLLAQSGMMEACELMKTPKEYLSMLMPPVKEETFATVPAAPGNVLSMAQLRTLPLGDQVKTLMKNVKVMQFSQLMSLLGPGLDAVSVLRIVQQVALLVQGCWVVKSEVLYPKDSLSPHSGIPAELLCRGRDFVMWRFTQERMLLRKDVAAIVKLPPDDVRDIFEQVAVLRVGLGWEFLQPRDDDFVRKHADVVQRQTMLWAGVQARLEKAYGLKKEDMLPKKPEPPPPGTVVTGEERLRLARSKVMEQKEHLERNYKQRHSQGAGRQTHNAVQNSGGVRIKEERASDAEEAEPMDVDGYNGASTLPNGEHSAAVEGAAAGDGPEGSAASRAEVQWRELCEFVQARLVEHTVLPLRELRRLLDRHLAALAPGHVLGAGVSPLMLQEAALQGGGRQIHVQIPPQFLSDANNDKVFANWNAGDAHEKPRQVLLEMFTKNYRLKRPTILSRLALAGPEPDKPTLYKLLKECCVSRNGMWYLKGTTPS